MNFISILTQGALMSSQKTKSTNMIMKTVLTAPITPFNIMPVPGSRKT